MKDYNKRKGGGYNLSDKVGNQFGNKQQTTSSSKGDLENQFTEELVLKTTDETYHNLIDLVKKYTEYLAGKNDKIKVTTHQIRNIFNEAKRVKEPSELWKLEISLAYIAGRNESNDKLKKLADMLIRLIRATKTKEQLDKFKEFFTSLVAYHKYNEKFS